MSSKWKASSPIQRVEAVSLLLQSNRSSHQSQLFSHFSSEEACNVFWGRRDKGMRNRDTETDICSKRCLVWKLEPINKSQIKSTTTRKSGIQRCRILPFITGLDMYQVAGLDMYQLSSPWIPLRILLSSILLMECTLSTSARQCSGLCSRVQVE